MSGFTSAILDSAEQLKPRKPLLSLSMRIALMIVIVIGFTLLLVFFLNYSNFRKSYLGLNLSRYVVIGKDLKQTIEAGINLGLALDENIRIQKTIEELKDRYPDVTYLTIFDDRGAIVFDTVKGRHPKSADPLWLTQLAATDRDEFWQGVDAATYQVGLPIVNNFDVKIGGLIVAYDKRVIDDKTSKTLEKLGIDLSAAIALFTIITVTIVYLLTRNLTATLHSADVSLDGFLDKQDNELAASSGEVSEIIGEVNQFKRNIRQVLQRLERIETGIDRLKDKEE